MQKEKALVTLNPIEKEIEDDREIWIEKVNFHLEELLQKANRDNQMIRHMAYLLEKLYITEQWNT